MTRYCNTRQGVYIDIVVQSVLQNLLMGGALAILIILLFLRNYRPTLAIAASIPISLLFAVALMYFSGVTLNIISLAGLALGVGMLVDNSIDVYKRQLLRLPRALLLSLETVAHLCNQLHSVQRILSFCISCQEGRARFLQMREKIGILVGKKEDFL